jgi:hypothetical protein
MCQRAANGISTRRRAFLAPAAGLFFGALLTSVPYAAAAQPTTVAEAKAAGWVHMPGLMTPPFCIHRVPSGSALSRANGMITATLNGIVVDQFPACLEAPVRLHHPRHGTPLHVPAAPSAAAFPPACWTTSPASCRTEPALTSNFSTASASSSNANLNEDGVVVPHPPNDSDGLPYNSAIDAIVTSEEYTGMTQEWGVPQKPSQPTGGETVYLWSGLNSDYPSPGDEVLQGVLAYAGADVATYPTAPLIPNEWAIFTCDVIGSTYVTFGDPVQVSPGDTIEFSIVAAPWAMTITDVSTGDWTYS